MNNFRSSVDFDDGYTAALLDLKEWFGTSGRSILPGKYKLNEKVISSLLSTIMNNCERFRTRKADFDILAFPSGKNKGGWHFEALLTEDECAEMLKSNYWGKALFKRQIANLMKEAGNAGN